MLLAAVVEWAQPRIRAEIDGRRARRDSQYAGSQATDGEGRSLDRRGFVATRSALKTFSYAQAGFWTDHGRFASTQELLGDVVARSILEEPETVNLVEATATTWWAWRRSESGRVFAIGCMSETDPLDRRYYDGPDVPEEGPSGPQWKESDTGNWSGDWS